MRGVYHRAGQRPDPVAYCALQTANSRSLVRSLELAQQVVAAFDSALERRLGGFLSGEGLLQLLLNDIANLHARAEPQAPGDLGRRGERKPPGRGLGSPGAVVITLRARQLLWLARDRQASQALGSR